MPLPAAMPTTQRFWRASVFPEFLLENGGTREGENKAIGDFLRLGIVAMPTQALESKPGGQEAHPGDYPLEREYYEMLKSYGRDGAIYAANLYNAYWGIRAGDRIILTFRNRLIAKGVALSTCLQNKKPNRLNPQFEYSLYFHVRWDPPSNPEKPIPTSAEILERKPDLTNGSFSDITDDDDALLKCNELNQKNMTRPYVETINLILCGPPGTGKTFRTKSTACEVCLGAKWVEDNNDDTINKMFIELTRGENARVEFVTFHPNYDYSDFIEGYRPQKDGFALEDGILVKLAKRAELDPQNNYLLIIDEINRGNIAKIFGETITLLEDDKRIGGDFELKSLLPASRLRFGLPSNLYIRGTMNTADRSIAMLDIALRRRFEFEEVPPNPELLKNADIKLSDGKSVIKQDELMKNLNKMLLKKEILGNRDYQIGHAWFAMVKKGKNKETAEELSKRLVSRFRKKILPLLQEWMYETPERLWGAGDDEGKSLLGGIFKQDDPSSITPENILKLQVYLKDALDKTK